MAYPSGNSPIPPVVPAAAANDGDDEERFGPLLGLDDGVDETARDVEDNTPVGQADAEEDARRTGADEDAI